MPQFLTDKLSIVDIKANDKAGNTFQIEIQISVPQSLKYRMLHNWAELYSRQLTQGETWNELKPVISIWLVCEPVFNDFSGFHSRFTFCDQKNNLQLAEHAKIHVIELSKWNKSQVENDLDIWAHFFKDGKAFSQDGLPDDMLTHEMEEAMAVLKQFSEKEKDYDRYMLRVEYLREQNTLEEDRAIAMAELEKAKIERDQVAKELGKTENKLDQAETKLDQTESKLDLTASKLDLTASKLDMTERELNQIKLSASKKEAVIAEAQLEIEKLKKALQKK